MAHIPHYIAGKPTAGSDLRRIEVEDPATGKVTGEVSVADRHDVDTAVAAATDAQPHWAATSLTKRAAVLASFAHLVSERRDDLARLITSENGKLPDDARAEVDRGLEIAEYACGLTELMKTDTVAQVTSTVDVHALRQPLGVAAGITPFNFPVMVGMWMHPLAIATGNAFVLKPSELVPSAANLVAETWSAAGLPDGVFGVLHGDGSVAAALVEHPQVAAISFVGSTPTARSVYVGAANAGKRVQALGGAKNHVVVLPDVDVEATADALISAAYGSAGQRCMAASVVVAVGSVADPIVDAIASRARSLVVGPGTDPGVQMGPLVSRAHLARVRAHVERAVEQGAHLVVDGRDTSVTNSPEGNFLGPCLFDRVTAEMDVYREEVFGPVLCVVRVSDLDEALAVVNANPYGNGAACFTGDGTAARRFSHAVSAGMVGINVAIPVPGAAFGFGGWKASLFGDTHIYGNEGVRFYTRRKVISSRWSNPRHVGAQPDSGSRAGVTDGLPSGAGAAAADLSMPARDRS